MSSTTSSGVPVTRQKFTIACDRLLDLDLHALPVGGLGATAARHRALGRPAVLPLLCCISNKYLVNDMLVDAEIFQIYIIAMSQGSRRGRPRKGLADKKSLSVLLRLDAREKQAFADSASVAGVPLAIWMRERLRRAAIRELEEAGREIAFVHWSEETAK